MITVHAEQLSVIKRSISLSKDEEVCGLFLGSGLLPNSVMVTKVVPTSNVAKRERHKRFEIDPVIRLQLERDTRNLPIGIVGHYHTHPGGEAVPSEIDLASAHEPNLFWLIIGTSGDTMKDIKAWSIDPIKGKFINLELSII
tara:strand:+ start:20627 stop:21052 length:426 start_codon:yes stop_codon:yes gene_type:complete